MENLVIYGKNNCKWCDEAKSLAESEKIKYTYKAVENVEVREELLYFDPDVKTVPQIYYRNQCVGGYEEFSKWISDKKLLDHCWR